MEIKHTLCGFLAVNQWLPQQKPPNKLGDNSAIKCLNGAAVGGNQRRKSSVCDVKSTTQHHFLMGSSTYPHFGVKCVQLRVSLQNTSMITARFSILCSFSHQGWWLHFHMDENQAFDWLRGSAEDTPDVVSICKKRHCLALFNTRTQGNGM